MFVIFWKPPFGGVGRILTPAAALSASCPRCVCVTRGSLDEPRRAPVGGRSEGFTRKVL